MGLARVTTLSEYGTRDHAGTFPCGERCNPWHNPCNGDNPTVLWYKGSRGTVLHRNGGKVMEVEITFFSFDAAGNDVEVKHKLPAVHEVCQRCEGHGTILNPSIGEHCYTAEEFEREFDEDEREAYFTRGGMYDIACPCCKGNRVVKVVDTEALNASQRKVYAKHLEHLREEERFERIQASERRMGC
ncbi:MAG: hypothetical protein EBT07_06675 [Actinobacteria bacterium]|nr:hypothetical protein [Actinomycetota bacterium]